MKQKILGETQVKDKPYKVALKVTLLTILFVLMIVSYVFSFSPRLYPNFLSNKVDGTFANADYYNAKDFDLIVIKPYSNIEDAKIDDIVCFSTNAGKGSGLLVGKDNGIFIVEKKNGSTIRISEYNIVGKQIKTVAFVGLPVKLFFSYYGALVLTILTLAYCCYFTFSRINYENTQQGKLLLRKFRTERNQTRDRNMVLKQIHKLGNLDYIAIKVLNGEYEENKDNLLSLDLTVKGSRTSKFKTILSCIYNTYIYKDDLTKEEQVIIGNLFELLTLCEHIDLDMTYMLIDLALKTKLINIDEENFMDSSSKFLETNLTSEDVLSFAAIIYVMVLKNPKLRNVSFLQIAKDIIEKGIKEEYEGKETVNGLANATIKLINL